MTRIDGRTPSTRKRRRDAQRSRLTREQRAAQRAFEQAISEHMDRLREAADGLQAWWQGADENEGAMHPLHVVNRVRKIANEISTSKSKS